MSLPKVFRNRRSQGFCTLTVFVVLAGVFLVVPAASAQGGFLGLLSSGNFEQVILNILGTVFQFLVWAVGSLLLLVTNLFITIAQYTGFGEARAVNVGWAIVRDLTNMFFVLLMLVIAFGTILGVEEFSYRRMLPRLLIMAVLINFSKVIAGIFIDFSQVIMLTFVNGFAAVAGANIVNMLKINTYTQLSPQTAQASAEGTTVTWDQVSGFFLALVMMGLALAVMLIMMIILVFRIVMLWLLVIMSPLAFFLSAFPRGRAAEAYGKWWNEFGNYLTIGPFMAFFLWLSFAVAGSGNISSEFPTPSRASAGEEKRVNEFVTVAGEPQNTLSYVIGIAMLMGGMMLSQQFSVLGGSMISGAANWVKDKGAKAAKAPLKAGAFLAKDIDSRIAARTGISLNVPAYFRGAAKGLEARQAARYKAGQAKVESIAQRGGVYGKIRQLAGDPEKFFKNYGIGGVGSLALTPITAPLSYGFRRFAPRSKKYYSDKAEEQKAFQKAREADVESIQRDRATKVKAASALIQIDALELRGKGLNAESDRMEELFKKADAGLMSKEESDELTALSTKGKGAFRGRSAAADFGELGAREVDQKKAAAYAGEEVKRYTEQALRSGPKGLPEEFAKHALGGADLSALADQARIEGDSAGLGRVVRKAATDDLDGFLEAEGFEASNKGLQKYLEKQKQLLKMSDQEMLSLANEVSSVAKSKDPKYAGMTKMAAGGVLRWSNEDEHGVVALKAKTTGDLGKKVREGAPIGYKDKEGRAQLDDSDVAALVKTAGQWAKMLERPERINPKQLDILVEKQSEILDRVGSVLGRGTPDFKNLEKQLTTLSTRMAALPPTVSQLMARVKATRPIP